MPQVVLQDSIDPLVWTVKLDQLIKVVHIVLYDLAFSLKGEKHQSENVLFQKMTLGKLELIHQ